MLAIDFEYLRGEEGGLYLLALIGAFKIDETLILMS